jgi:hypothetical protein
MNRWTSIGRAALTASALIGWLAIAGCAVSTRLPECHGPWTPINPTVERRAHE